MRRLVLALALIAVALPASAPGARARDQWLELRTPHFVVVSSAREEQARSVSLEFERVRTMLARALTKPRADPRDAVVVLAVSGEDGLRELLPQYWERKGERPVAAYWGGPYRHCIVLRVDAPDRERFRRVLHEYIHLLTHANVPDVPVWLDEGLSEFWATAIVQDDAVEVGRPAPRNLKVLRAQRQWIPLHELLGMERAPDPRDEHRLSLFYAESWALVHYLMLGGSSTSLALAPPGDLGNVSQLEANLAAYVRDGKFRALRMDVPQHETEALSVREVPPAQSLAVRAGCLVEGERPAAARPLLAQALAAEPGNTAAMETLGYLEFQQNNAVEAARWFDRAIASGSADHLAYFYRGILAGPVPDTDGEPIRTADYLRKAIELAPGFVPAYVRLADLYVKNTVPFEALPLLRRATELEPEETRHWLDLGKVLVRLNLNGEAIEAGRRGLAVARSARSGGLAETFLRDVERTW